MWQTVVIENALEKALKGTDIQSVCLFNVSFLLSQDKLIAVERGSESYCFDEGEIVPVPAESEQQRKQPPSSRKRPLRERLMPRNYDATISRDHYGVNFGSPSDEVSLAITNFLDECRSDLVG